MSQWKLCCGQPQSWQDICQDVCPSCSSFAAVALKMLISSVRIQVNVLHHQEIFTAVVTFPFALLLSFCLLHVKILVKH